MSFAPVEDLIAAIGRGEMVILVDDADRENEGDLMLAAVHATPAKVGFMLRHTSGIICVSLPGERLDQLRLPPMVAVNTDVRRTAFTISVDAREGTSTGISAADRSRTIGVLIDPEAQPEDLNRPGHTYPLRYEPGENPNGATADVAGVLGEDGNVMGLMPHPEHAVDPLLGSGDGALILASLVDAARDRMSASAVV